MNRRFQLALALLGAGWMVLPVRAEANQDPVEAFQTYCYEPNRAGGRSRHPDAEQGWQPLPDELRAQLNLSTEAGSQAWIQPGQSQGELLLLQIHERQLKNAGVHSGQMRLTCEVVATSSELQPRAISARLEALIGDPPGADGGQILENLGYPTPDGWTQECWTILTRIKDREWKPYRHDGQPRCVWLTNPANYTVSQYVVVRLLARADASTAVLAMDRTLPPRALKKQ